METWSPQQTLKLDHQHILVMGVNRMNVSTAALDQRRQGLSGHRGGDENRHLYQERRWMAWTAMGVSMREMDIYNIYQRRNGHAREKYARHESLHYHGNGVTYFAIARDARRSKEGAQAYRRARESKHSNIVLIYIYTHILPFHDKVDNLFNLLSKII